MQNTNIQNNAKGLEELQQENIKLKEKLEKQNSQIPTGQASGENITINDSSDLPFEKFKITGNSKQETRSGKNLTNYKDWIRISPVGSLIISENLLTYNLTNNCYGLTDVQRTLKANTAYTAYVDYEFTGELAGTWGMRVKKNETWGVPANKNIINFTTDETGLIVLAFYVATPYTGEDAVLTLKNVRLHEGTYTKDTIPDYEEYGAMPSPDFPSEIENVTSVNVKVCNKNLIINENLTNETYDDEGNKSTHAQLVLDNDFIPVKQQSYYFKAYGQINGYNVAVNRIIEFDANKNFLRRNDSMAGSTEFLYEPTSDCKFIQILYRTTTMSNITPEQVKNIEKQLEVGTVPTPYIPHEEQVFNFPLSEGQKLMKDDYLADDGIHTKKYQRVFDGTESWTLTMNNDIPCFYIRNSNLSTALNEEHEKVCTHFPYIMQSFGTAPVNTICENTLGGGLPMFIFKTNVATTLEGWKTWLANQKTAGTPLIVEYKLAKEVITPYTEEQQIVYEQIKEACSYKNVTNIFSLDEVSPILEVTYKKDLETMFNNINNAILGGN